MIDRCERDCAVELSCDEREQIVAQIVETAVEQDQDHNAGSNRVQGRESLVRHDLVDEQLKKIGTGSAIKFIASAATTMSRINDRSAKSFEVNQEKPK